MAAAGNTLVIVESPAKGKTIKKYLGKGYEVLASYGHVRDLIPKEGAVDPNNDFAMKYQNIERNAKHLDAIAKGLKKADTLLLATDPDREGEAISWHICEALKEKLKNKTVARVVFHEITKSAVQDAVDNPRELAMDLVDAQQARRSLDYLVGFNLSPLLWKKIRRGLSAGRVQSPALRMIVEREIEIEKFKAREYWMIKAAAAAKGHAVTAKLTRYKGEKVEQFTVTQDSQAESIEKELLAQAGGELLVHKVEKKQRKRNPAAPFTTSTLQQEAARKLGFTTRKTMQIAQQLYEGVDIGSSTVGLITYMRTDSVHLATEAVEEIRGHIAKHYGEDNVPDAPRTFKTKSKNAQEAHEAIRPTSALRTVKSLELALTQDQKKLYDLIWKRTVASQMQYALIDTVAVDLACGSDDNMFRANGSTIAKPGFMQVYLEGQDDSKGEDDENLLPPMQEGEKLDLDRIICSQHFTEPPPRFSEASLVKALEEHGIGRPSTYASIISTLQARDYVELNKKRFYPTDVGRVVVSFLTKFFTQYVDYDFTAKLEDELDDIARGEKNWVPVMREFWQPFTKQVTIIDETVERKDVTQEKMDEDCPECGKPLSIRLGRRGRFIGCTAYPECSYTRNLKTASDEDKDPDEPDTLHGRLCPDCEKPLQIKEGRYGKFIGCSGYPDCKHIEPLVKPKDTGVVCPECSKGKILQRKSRNGKIFYSCERYPDCKYALWNEPVDEACPKCAWPILSIKVTKRSGKQKVCPRQSCKFVESLDDDE